MSLRLTSPVAHVLSATAEALVFTQTFPQWCPEHGAFAWAFVRLLKAHISFMLLYHFIFLGLVHPYFLCPLRDLPTARGQWRRSARLSTADHFAAWHASTEDNGLILLRTPFHKNRLLLSNPKALADVLVHNAYDFEKPKSIRNFLRRVLGDGLIVVEGDEHNFQRKHILPAFGFRHIRELYAVMWLKSVAMVERINAEMLEAETIEMYEWSSKATLDIIGIAALGREFNVIKNTEDELVRCYKELLEPSVEKLIYFVLTVLGPAKLVQMLPWKLNQDFKNATDSLRMICRRLVLEKRELIKADADHHFDILSLLIKSSNFADDAMVDQMLTFLAAGHETTSSAFTWLVYLLAAHPDAQRRIRDEVRAALPANPIGDSNIDVAQVLESLPYLNGVCSESLRLYPTVPNTLRVAVRDSNIIGRLVPKGTEIVISAWAINRSPKLWGPDALVFNPERWIDVDGQGNCKPNNSGGADSNYSQLTFLHGPRSCIGQNFAKAELRCLAAAFVKAFEWELVGKVEDVVPFGAITTKPKSGLHLRLRPLETC